MKRYRFVLAGLIAVLALQICRATHNVVDLDLWHELALARETIAAGHVPSDDVFAYTPTLHPVVHHEWGAGMIAYGILLLGGGTGIMLLNLVLAACAMALSLACCRRRQVQSETVALAGLIMTPILAIGYAPIRAQAYSYVFFALLLYGIELDRSGRRIWIPIWLLVFLLWINVHASCVLALGVLGCYWVESLLHRRPALHVAALLPAMLAMLVLNPYGTAYYGYLARALSMSRPNISEWGPIWTAGNAPLLPLVAISLASALYAFIRGRLGMLASIVLTISATAALLHGKMAPYYALAWFCYVPAAFSESRVVRVVLTTVRENWSLARVVWAAVMLLSVGGSIWFRCWQPVVPQRDVRNAPAYPVRAVDYLARAHFTGRLMVSFNYGAYVTWKLYPAVRVSMDSRYEVAFPHELVVQNQEAFESAASWRAFNSRYPADAVLLECDSPIQPALMAAGWTRAYRDETFAVFTRPGVVVDGSQFVEA